jgi:hypothetical protein
MMFSKGFCFLYKNTHGIINAICNGLETRLGTKPEKIKKM